MAIAVLLRAVSFGEKWAIVAPTQNQAQIIMNYVIEHLFDNPVFLAQLLVDIPLEKLKREKSKTRITFRGGGEIFTQTADTHNRKRLLGALMGFGAPNIIIDESALIDDDIYAGIKRMLGDNPDNFLLEISNHFYSQERRHFKRNWQSNDYERIFIDYHQAVNEGRFKQEFIEEMRREAFFEILYECRFPDEDTIDERGYYTLLNEKQIETAIGRIVEPRGVKRLGVDIGRGGDESVFVLRYDNYAKVLNKNRSADLMTQVNLVKQYCREEGIDPKNVFIDDTGVGGGVSDRLKELGLSIMAVKVGEKAEDDEKYANQKAEMSWEARNWILTNALENNRDFYQLSWIKYKEDTSSRLKIEPKEDLLKRGTHSPDVADALILTFNPQRELNIRFV